MPEHHSLGRPLHSTSGGKRKLTVQPPPPSATSTPEHRKTALHPLHVAQEATMVPFGNFSMPLQYPDLSLSASHAWTREKCSLFDVSHMVQYTLSGPGAQDFLETLTPAELRELEVGASGLSVFLHEVTGGVVDDCLITRLQAQDGELHRFYVVGNAGCRAKDWDFLSTAMGKWERDGKPAVQLQHLQDEKDEAYGLLALQGPLAASILQSVLAPSCKVDIKTWYFGRSHPITLSLPSGTSLPILASRGGYTGEDGFELSVPASQTLAVAEHLLQHAGADRLRLAGLGARDSLRLEAGMCLYGHDIDDNTTPVEGGLGWVVARSRRGNSTPADDRPSFNGADVILPQLLLRSQGGTGVKRKRVGLIVSGPPAREGAEVVDAEGQVMGKVTSGCPSPTLGVNVAMAYVPAKYQKSGTEVGVLVRGKKRKGVVSKMPFVGAKYFKEGAMPG
ncbi:Aminomethyltransferase, mitochondrial [Teratosphaeriaceae sp. CCFEE 6253]|nr:Aminomethyltransferase, mitochondrial [Teratosphaeriaceae sp. CCFEE 6253]